MGLFDKGKQPLSLTFNSRAEAFGYMLNYLITEKRLDPMEAATKADQFAEIFAHNMGIPPKVEPEPKGIDKYLSMADKISNYIEEHPKLVEYGIPAVTFIAGLFTGKEEEKLEEQNEASTYQPIRNMSMDNVDNKQQPSNENSSSAPAEEPTQQDKQEPINWDNID